MTMENIELRWFVDNYPNDTPVLQYRWWLSNPDGVYMSNWVTVPTEYAKGLK